MKFPETLQEAIVYFSDSERAFIHAVNMRWPDGNVTCPRCGGAEHSFIKTRMLWFCKGCKKQFTVKVGTIFEDSPITLDKWMTAVWMLCSCKNGISSYEIASTLKVSQKCAWFMMHRVREAMKNNSILKFGGSDSGPVESDETFVGPNPQKMHRSRVNTLRQRRGQEMRGDAYLVGYDHLSNEFVHEVVNHAQEYVRGQVHTQGLDNFWSLLKRTLRGTYVAVEPFHLDRYLMNKCFAITTVRRKIIRLRTLTASS